VKAVLGVAGLALLLAIGAGLPTASPAASQAPPAYKQEDFATDPLWEGLGNRLRSWPRSTALAS
jgi:hypothetical protein